MGRWGKKFGLIIEDSRVPWSNLCFKEFHSFLHQKIGLPFTGRPPKGTVLSGKFSWPTVLLKNAKSLALWVSCPKGNGFFALLLAGVKWGEIGRLLYQKNTGNVATNSGGNEKMNCRHSRRSGPDWPHGKYRAAKPSLQGGAPGLQSCSLWFCLCKVVSLYKFHCICHKCPRCLCPKCEVYPEIFSFSGRHLEYSIPNNIRIDTFLLALFDLTSQVAKRPSWASRCKILGAKFCRGRSGLRSIFENK